MDKKIIQCVQCNAKLRIPDTTKSLLITCPKCGHEFIYSQSHSSIGYQESYYKKRSINRENKMSKNKMSKNEIENAAKLLFDFCEAAKKVCYVCADNCNKTYVEKPDSSDYSIGGIYVHIIGDVERCGGKVFTDTLDWYFKRISEEAYRNRYVSTMTSLLEWDESTFEALDKLNQFFYIDLEKLLCDNVKIIDKEFVSSYLIYGSNYRGGVDVQEILKAYDKLRGHKKSGCYIATAVYGSYDCPQVWTLRRYRDYALAENWYGRAFIKIYYAFSPILVRWFGKTTWFKNLWKNKLDRMVDKLQDRGFEDTPYNDKQF